MNPHPLRILLVEDDKTIASILCQELQRWEYDAKFVQKFTEVLEEFSAFDPHLVLMDISLPSYNGYHWCSEIRRISSVPMVFLSSRTEKMDILMAMQMGADDFIEKPFDLEIAVAKIQAVLRRSIHTASLPILDFGPVSLDTGRLCLVVNHREIPLTANESKIMTLLFQGRGSFVSRHRMMDVLWEGGQFIDDNTLSVNIARLRSKLSGMGLPDFIRSKKGAGYALNASGGAL